MASGNEIHDHSNNPLSAVVVTPLPTLPVDVITEIFCRLPVKLLLQLRCVCKSWNSLISDSKYIEKHLRLSTRRRLHFISYNAFSDNKYTLRFFPLESVFTDETVDEEIEYSPNSYNGNYPVNNFRHFIGSCNGILCFADKDKGLVILWNPSIRKFKELAFFEIRKDVFIENIYMTFGFGYDSFTDKYKVVVVLNYSDRGRVKTEVKVHTVGTNIWRSVPGFPFDAVTFKGGPSGNFVSGRINWLVSKDLTRDSPRFIVSFDLANESYQKISLPCIGGVDVDLSTLGVLRDCLCVTSKVISGDDVWIMKQYGNKESWTKLFTVPFKRKANFYLVRPIYIFEDDRVLLKFHEGSDFDYLVLYDPKSGYLSFTYFQIVKVPDACVYVESLISPYSLC